MGTAERAMFWPRTNWGICVKENVMWFEGLRTLSFSLSVLASATLLRGWKNLDDKTYLWVVGASCVVMFPKLLEWIQNNLPSVLKRKD